MIIYGRNPIDSPQLKRISTELFFYFFSLEYSMTLQRRRHLGEKASLPPQQFREHMAAGDGVRVNPRAGREDVGFNCYLDAVRSLGFTFEEGCDCLYTLATDRFMQEAETRIHPSIREDVVRALSGVGRHFHNIGYHFYAVGLLDKALSLGPENKLVHRWLGDTCENPKLRRGQKRTVRQTDEEVDLGIETYTHLLELIGVNPQRIYEGEETLSGEQRQSEDVRVDGLWALTGLGHLCYFRGRARFAKGEAGGEDELVNEGVRCFNDGLMYNSVALHAMGLPMEPLRLSDISPDDARKAGTLNNMAKALEGAGLCYNFFGEYKAGEVGDASAEEPQTHFRRAGICFAHAVELNPRRRASKDMLAKVRGNIR